MVIQWRNQRGKRVSHFYHHSYVEPMITSLSLSYNWMIRPVQVTQHTHHESITYNVLAVDYPRHEGYFLGAKVIMFLVIHCC